MSTAENNRRVACVDSLRISPHEESEILAELSQQPVGAAGGAGRAMPTAATAKERRRNNRVPFLSEAGLFVQMKHPGGSVANYLVRTRNLSPTGIAFLHGSFVYTGTTCVLALHDKSGKIMGIDGRVVRCQHVRGHVHDIGVRFSAPIDLNQFLLDTNAKPGSAGADDAPGAASNPDPSAGDGRASEELPKLAGHVLCAEENETDAELLKFYLESLGVTVTLVAGGLEALDYLEGRKFDAVITAVWLTGMTGVELAEAARASGFKKPIIALTADDRIETRVEALNRGCTDLLTKPYGVEQLVRVLGAHLPRAKPAGPAVEPLPSDMWCNVKMRPLIAKFVARLDGDVREIDRLTSAGPGSVELLGKLCMGLKGSAGSFGYPKISRIAAGLTELVLIDNSLAREKVKAAVAELTKLSMAAAVFIEKESGPGAVPTRAAG